MAYKDERPRPDESGRMGGEAHPDAPRNLEYALHKIKGIELLSSMKIIFYDVDSRTNIINDPKIIHFYWRINGVNYGNPISFHQPRDRFQECLDRTINWCYSNDFIGRQNDTRMNPYR